MRKIEVKNINGFNNLIIDGRYIYSKRNPYKSLKKFISNYESLINNSDSFLIIYGYGLGLIIEELKNIEKEIFIFDFDDEILQQVKTKKELSNIKGFNNIHLFLGEKYLNLFKLKLKLVNDLIIYEPLLAELKYYNEELFNALESYVIAKKNLEKNKKAMNKNKQVLSKYDYFEYGIENYFKKYKLNDKPILIVSGGPSTEKYVTSIKKYRNKIYLFSVGRALNFLIKNNIIPDNIIIIDSNPLMINQFKDNFDLKTPLLSLDTSYARIFELYKGEKYIFCNEKNNKLNIFTGKSVSVAALDIAIKMNPSKIAFVGQDLAYVDGKYYAGENYIRMSIRGVKTVKGINNKILRTSTGMLEHKKNLEKLIINNNNIEYINLSLGASIIGTKRYKNFYEIF